MKKLLRSSTNRIVAGVCGGVAEYLNVDPTVIRLIFAATVICGGAGLLLYLVAWLLVPMQAS